MLHPVTDSAQAQLVQQRRFALVVGRSMAIDNMQS